MRSSTTIRTRAVVLALTLSAGFALAGCGGDDGNDEVSGTSPGEGQAGCEQLEEFGDLSGETVQVYTSIVDVEGETQEASYKKFTECTGAEVAYEGSKEFEAQLLVRLQGGNQPDVAYIPQPGLLRTVVQDTGLVVEPPAAVEENVDEFFGEDWKTYGTVDDTFYAAPLGANVKSLVWYSPTTFSDNGYEVPETWDDMIALSDQMVADGVQPWCAGIGSGDATGWPITDWLEDVMLREVGPDVYDEWVNHEIAFDDERVAGALDRVGEILKNDEYVNGGIGDVRSIATTEWTDGGLPILDGKCGMHRQASFYAVNWPEGTTVAEDGDAFAFYLPTTNEDNGRPVLGGGEFVAAFDDRPAVQAFQTYLSSDVWANEKAKATPDGGWVNANTGLDPANLTSPIDQLSAEIFQDPESVFRFDGSDQMPAKVGAGTFWKEAIAWVTGEQDTADMLGNIESSWPS